MLHSIISVEQSGFVKGWLIHDNIFLAQELMHSLKKKVQGSKIVTKLDMHKAYDIVSWLALTKIIRKCSVLVKDG